MSKLSTNLNDFEDDLVALLSSTVDVSLRDGNQALYATAWKKDDLVAIAKEYEVLAEMLVEEYGTDKPIMETGGGTIPQQSANLHGEHCTAFVEAYAEAMPHVIQRDLNRGAAGYALTAQPKGIRAELVKGAIDSGIGITRIFDCMGDVDNISHTAQVVQDLRASGDYAADSLPEVEIAISYTGGETGKEQRVRDVQDYIDEGVSYIKKGLGQRLALKDYGGFASEEEMVAIVKGWREALGENIPIAVHSHGDRAEALSAVLIAGGKNTNVDTAMGKLSGTASHTNLKDLMAETLGKTYDFDAAEIASHPLMQQLDTIEHTINERAEAYQDKTSQPSDALQQALNKALIAGGGTQATLNAGKEFYKLYTGMAKQQGTEPLSEEAFMIHALEECAPKAWEAAGRFDTVTPGTKIQADTAFTAAAHELTGQTTPLSKAPASGLLQGYKNIVMGRFGENRGLEKGIGNSVMRDVFLLEDTLKTINHMNIDNKDNIKYTLIIAAGLNPETYDNLTFNTSWNIEGTENIDLDAAKARLVAMKGNFKPEQHAEILSHMQSGMLVGGTSEAIIGQANTFALEQSAAGQNLDAAYYDYLCLGDQGARKLAALTEQQASSDKPAEIVAPEVSRATSNASSKSIAPVQ